MPFKSIYIQPQRVLTRKGVSVFFTYTDDDANDRSRYWFKFCKAEDYEEAEEFDIRNLPNYVDGADVYRILSDAIKAGFLQEGSVIHKN